MLISRMPHARGKDFSRPHGPLVQWHTSHRYVREYSLPQIESGKTLRSFVCRGSDPLKKRIRWLHLYGIEKQYIETKFWGIEDSGTPSGWWVFHSSLENHIIKKCHTGTSPPMFSGVQWKTHTFNPQQRVRIGIEWTPSGYRAYYGGAKLTRYSAYGYSTPSHTSIYGYKGAAVPTSGLVNKTVSHAYEMMKIELNPSSDTDTVAADDWADDLKIDYLRIYQPIDKYQYETKSYE